MEFLMQYGLFLAEVVTVLVATVIVISVVASLGQRAKHEPKPELYVQKLNDAFDEQKDQLNAALMDKAQYKQYCKEKDAHEKGEEKGLKAKLKRKIGKREKTTLETSSETTKKRVFVIGFEGDIKASAVDDLARCVTAVLMVADSERDEVVINLESAGGLVHGYGLAAAQLQRVRERGVHLTVLVDRIAASGGYMMAAVANRILAAPFAIVGSIGVVAQIPNFNRLLKKHEVDLELHTAGEFKRTLTLFGENTAEGRMKFQHELEETHELFKAHLNTYRSVLNVEQVATGEHWYGSQAKALNLVDDLVTSEQYLAEAANEADVFEISFEAKKSVTDKIFNLINSGVKSGLGRWLGAPNPAAVALAEAHREQASPFSRIRLQADALQGSND